MGDGKQGRRRRSSSLMIYKEPLESPERLSDQSALPNLNATWVNAKGAYSIVPPDSLLENDKLGRIQT